MIKGANNDGVWNEVPYQIKLKILPPPWKTWWAYTIYIALFILLLWATRYLGLRQAALKNQLTFFQDLFPYFQESDRFCEVL